MESAFQFSNPTLTKMEFCINEDFENGRDKLFILSGIWRRQRVIK